MKKCLNCGFMNESKAKFCEKCGLSYEKTGKIRKNRILGIGILTLCFLIVVVGGGVFLLSSTLAYSGKIDEGYRLMKNNKHREATALFENAINIKPNKPKGYIGKAEALAGEVAYDTVPKIILALREGYRKTESNEIIDSYSNVAEILKGKGHKDKAQSLLHAGFMETGDKELQEKTDDMRKGMAAEYESVLKKYRDEDAEDGVYYLYDIDKDSIPELILSCKNEKNTRLFDMYTYKSGRATRLENTLTYPEVQLCSAPDQNGVLFLGRKQADGKETYDCADIISIRDGKVITDGFYSQNEETKNKNFDPKELTEGSELLPFDSLENGKEIKLFFAVFDSMEDAYNYVLEILDKNCASYAMYDVDRNGTKDFIVLCNEKMAKDTDLKIGKIYAFNGKKLKKLGEVHCFELYQAPVGGFAIETVRKEGISDIQLITYNMRQNQLESAPYLQEDRNKTPPFYAVNGKETSWEAYEKEKKNIAFIPTTDASAVVKMSR